MSIVWKVFGEIWPKQEILNKVLFSLLNLYLWAPYINFQGGGGCKIFTLEEIREIQDDHQQLLQNHKYPYLWF